MGLRMIRYIGHANLFHISPNLPASQLFVYLHAYSKAQRTTIKCAHAEEKTKYTHTQTQKTKQGNLYHLDNSNNSVRAVKSAITLCNSP
jgi:hypothetical protein